MAVLPLKFPVSALLQSSATDGQAVAWNDSNSRYEPTTIVGSVAGAGTELQYRAGATTLGAITSSSWNGVTLTLPKTTAVASSTPPLIANRGDEGIIFQAQVNSIERMRVEYDSDLNQASMVLNGFAGFRSGLQTDYIEIIGSTGTITTTMVLYQIMGSYAEQYYTPRNNPQNTSGVPHAVISSYAGSSGAGLRFRIAKEFTGDRSLECTDWSGNRYFAVTTEGDVVLGGTSTAAELRMLEPSGGGSSYTGFKSPALAGNVIYTMPTAAPAANNKALICQADGTLSWGNGAAVAEVSNAPAGTTQTIDWSSGFNQLLDLSGASGAVTVTLSNPPATAWLVLRVLQGGTARDITWPASVKWEDSGEPTWSSDTSKTRIVTMYYNGTDYYASSSDTYS